MDLGRLRLRLHLRGRLQVAFLALVASSLLLSAGAAYLVYSRRVASEIEPRVVQGRTVLQSSLQELIDRADALSYSYRTQPIFISRLEGTSSQGQFLDQFTLLLNQTNLDILDLVDIEGKLVIDKGFHIDRVGDSRLGLAGVREAVAGKKTRTIGLHDGSPAALVVVPIRNSSGQLDGGATGPDRHQAHREQRSGVAQMHPPSHGLASVQPQLTHSGSSSSGSGSRP